MESTRKDTQNTWIGKIPDSWTLKRLKYHFTIIGGNGFSPEYQGNEYGDYPFFKAGDISQAYAFGQNISTSPNWVTRELATIERYNIIPAKSILFPKIGEAMRKNSRAITSIDCCVDNNCQALVPQNIDIYYAYYLLRCIDMRWFENYGPVPSLNNQKLLNTFIPYPPLEVQEQIGKWLNKKCAELDSLSSDIQKEVETLEAYKRSLITEAVTKGLDKYVPTKASGYDYLGSVPVSWDVQRLRFLGTCSNGISKSHEYFGSGFPFVTYGDVYNNFLLPKASSLIESSEIERRRYSVEKGDIFFTRTSETIEEIAFSSACLKTIEEACFAGFLIRFRPTVNMSTKFLMYYFRSDIHRKFFTKEMNLVTRASLSQDLLKNLPVLIPPRKEQDAIAEFLDSKCSEIDSIITSKEQQLETLSAYKKSLIYEYVTGKKEVK